MLVQQRTRFVRAGAFANIDQPVMRRHDVAHPSSEVGLETVVAVGDHAQHPPTLLPAFYHRETRYTVLLRQFQQFANGDVGRDRHRVFQHAGLVTLDLGHFGRLLLDREVLVHDADAAFLGQGNSQPRLGDGVHGRRNQGQIQADVAG